MEAGRDTYPAEARIPELVLAYSRAQQRISEQIRTALAQGRLHRAAERRRQLAAILTILDELGAITDPQARKLVEDLHTQASDRTVRRIIGLGVSPVTPATFNSVNQQAIRLLADEMVGRLGDARQVVGRRARDVFARAGRDAVLQGLLGADGNRRAVSRELAMQLQDRGIRAFTDSAGRQWKLDTYAEMVARTTTRQVVVEAAKLRMAGHGISIARVTRHGSSCDICAPWEGLLVSLDGAVSAYQGEPVASLGALPGGGPPFHPNCRHTITPVATAIEDLRRELSAA